MQCVYPKPELLELSEYLIPNGAWLKLPSRFKKPFQFLFQFLHPTPTRIFETCAPRTADASRAVVRACRSSIGPRPPLIQPRVGNRYHLKQFMTFSPAILSRAPSLRPPIGQLGQSILADRRNSGPSCLEIFIRESFYSRSCLVSRVTSS